MTHSNEKKSHAFKGIGEKLNPTIYQVRFMKLDEPIQFEAFPELKELGGLVEYFNAHVVVPLNYVQIQQRKV